MRERELDALLQLAKSAAAGAGQSLLRGVTDDHRRYTRSHENPKEIKAVADAVLEEEILRILRPAGLPILSEEAGLVSSAESSTYRFIVDPLDGTFNFVKG